MSDELKKLLEGLPIKVIGKEEAEIDGWRWSRHHIETRASGPDVDADERLAARVILRLMDEYEKTKPVNPGQEFEELKNYTIQECGKGIELKLTWEPGTVIRNANGMMLLLNEPGAQYLTGTMWNTTNMQDGLTADLILSPELWEVYRLPHEFKVGDWFEWHSDSDVEDKWNGPFQVKKVINAKNLLWITFDQPDYKDNEVCTKRCRHVPAPRKEAIAELARQEMLDGHYTCDPVKPQDPFTGPHWDLMNRQQSHNKYALCIRELADEVRRLKEDK